MRTRNHTPPRPCNAVGTCGIPVVARIYCRDGCQYPVFTSAHDRRPEPQDGGSVTRCFTFTAAGNQLDRCRSRQDRLAPCRKLNAPTGVASRTGGSSSGSTARTSSTECATAVRTGTRDGIRRTPTPTARPAQKLVRATRKPTRSTTSSWTRRRASSSRGRGSNSSTGARYAPGNATTLYTLIARTRRHIATLTDRAVPFQKFGAAGSSLSRSTVRGASSPPSNPVGLLRVPSREISRRLQ